MYGTKTYFYEPTKQSEVLFLYFASMATVHYEKKSAVRWIFQYYHNICTYDIKIDLEWIGLYPMRKTFFS
jgi:hypothetical protein